MNSKLSDASNEFAVKIIRLCDRISGHQSIVNRLENDGVAIGESIYDAGFIKDTDAYVKKLNDTLDLCRKTQYWLELLFKSDLISKSVYSDLNYECETIGKLIVSDLNSANENPNKSIIK